jgi:UDP-N-acetylglucosamine 1-carboxyvinyltransferase
LGPILSRFHSARVSYPGGCEIGKRPIDLHIEGLRALGVKTTAEGDIIECDGGNMRGGEITFRLPSVGATENTMMAAVLTQGTTIIKNAAREPEIEDLARFINTMGGRVYGAGTSTIIIEGVSRLRGGEYTPIPDRIVTGTYLAACAMCGGKIQLNNVIVGHVYSIIDRLQAAGCRFKYKDNAIVMTAPERPKAIPFTSTMPYPGFPTDMQAQLTAMLSVADGQSVLVENLFENRFRYTGQLKKMGADIEVIGTKAVINGVPILKGCKVEAQDLRGGAALVIAGMRAKGNTSVYGVEHIDRGYYKIEDDLNALNANIARVE